jgi:SAP domain/LETM1-like protein
VNYFELIFFFTAYAFTDEPPKDDLDHTKAVQLKALCKEHGLKVSGKKAELQDRRRQHLVCKASDEPVDDFDSMSNDDLRDVCKTRGLSMNGKTTTDMR